MSDSLLTGCGTPKLLQLLALCPRRPPADSSHLRAPPRRGQPEHSRRRPFSADWVGTRCVPLSAAVGWGLPPPSASRPSLRVMGV